MQQCTCPSLVARDRDRPTQDAEGRRNVATIRDTLRHTGEPWSQRKRKLSGFNLVFSPHKSATSPASSPQRRPRAGDLERPRPRQRQGDAVRRPRPRLGAQGRRRGGRRRFRGGRLDQLPPPYGGPTLPIQEGPGGQIYLFDAPVAGDPHMHVHNFLNLAVTAEGRIG